MILAIVGASGKLGFATLNSLLDNGMIARDIVATTSSDSGAQKLADAERKGVAVRRVDYDDDEGAWQAALQGVDKLYLISSPRVSSDHNYFTGGKGREEDHFKVLRAAKGAGVKHVYYTSLAFANPSKSYVMEAHIRTESWLKQNWTGDYTIIREGCYNESWPLYLGYYKVPDDNRSEILVGGDSKISWTSIPDLGLTNAIILMARSEEWAGRTFYLAQEKAWTLKEVAVMVSKARGKEVRVKEVPREDYESSHIERGANEAHVKWWSPTYDAIRDGELEIHDPTLEQLLAIKGVKPKPMEETVADMFAS